MDRLDMVLQHVRRLRAGAVSTAKGPCNASKQLARIVAFDEVVSYCESLKAERGQQKTLEQAA